MWSWLQSTPQAAFPTTMGSSHISHGLLFSKQFLTLTGPLKTRSLA